MRNRKRSSNGEGVVCSMSEEFKICNGACGDNLPLSKFYICPTSVNGRAGICIECQKNKVYEIREQRRAKGLTVGGVIPKWRIKAMEKLAEDRGEPITASELAIEKERHKRRVEKEIEQNLRYDEGEPEEREFIPVSVGRFFRQPTGKIKSWGTW